MRQGLAGLALALSLVLGSLMMATPAVGAAYSLFPSNCPAASAVCQDKKNTANPISGSNGIILKVTTIIAVLAGIVAVIMIIVGGLKFITSGGDAEKAAGARRTLLYAIVGLIVIALATVIIEFVVSHL